MHTLSAAVFAAAIDFPVDARATLVMVLGGGACVGCVLLLLIVGYFLLRGGRKAVAPGLGLLEDLSAYPAPPSRNGRRRLTVQGRPSRVRLIVLAPVGKRDLREFGEPEELLNRVVPGLGDVAREDRPRIRVWPPQLSKQGFAPTFFRNTRRPDGAEGSHWTLLAGPAQAGTVPILLGVAVWSEETGSAPQQSVEPPQWSALLRVEP